ncbi:hypothetical protein M9H77_27624 [Catharanthus roseus]|uniref:Uncharacterized protein n=1 Tax=Catharanthus roseus TaxID=4058 RepID=A0ACC0AH63_CATRO|nr:hypothetical protein M9H77_27624 [Catharanthus roseus]
MQAAVTIDLGHKAHVPIISFSATSPSLASNRSPYSIRATQNDSSQVRAISSIIKAFGWREVVPIYVDNEFGVGIIPFLADSLGKISDRIPYRSVISSLATDDQLIAEIYQLMTMQTRVFIVHMPVSLGTNLFNKAKELGMLSDGHTWIITDSLADWLDSFNPSPHVPQTKELESFAERWKVKFRQNNPTIKNPQLNVFGDYGHMIQLQPLNSTDLDTIPVSNNGPILLQEILSTTFKGISRDFEIVDGQLQSSAYKIVNVMVLEQNKRLTVINEPMFPIARTGLGTIYGLASPPKGWMIPTNGQRLRLLVPVKVGFTEFVKVTRDASTNTTKVTGHCIGIFNTIMSSLPYAVEYDYIPFSTSDGKSAGSHNDRVYQG